MTDAGPSDATPSTPSTPVKASPSGSPAPQQPAPAADHRRLLIGAGAAAALAGLGVALWRDRSADPGASTGAAADTAAPKTATTGEAADPMANFWALTLPTPAGTELALASLQGAPLLVNFWATWCAPCVREMPALDRLHTRFAGQPGSVLGIAIDSLAPVQAFLDRTPVGFPVVLAGFEGTTWARHFGNTQGGLPYSVLIGADGQVLERHIGELKAEDLQAWAQRMGLA